MYEMVSGGPCHGSGGANLIVSGFLLFVIPCKRTACFFFVNYCGHSMVDLVVFEILSRHYVQRLKGKCTFMYEDIPSPETGHCCNDSGDGCVSSPKAPPDSVLFPSPPET